MIDRADISVVVASFSGEPSLRRCLESLEAGAAAAEWIVATNAPSEAVARLSARFPAARFLQAAEKTTVFELRSLGLEQARGRLIALIEDHCTISPEWLEAIDDAHRAGRTVVGGPIENGLDRKTYDWALYFCEYCAYMPPMQEGPVSALLGANSAYDRDALWSCHEVWRGAFYENEVHDALRSAGHTLYLAEKACVRSHLPMSFRSAAAHLFAGGRRFGGYRKSQSSAIRKIFWIVASPAVPLVLFARIVRQVASRRPARLLRLAFAFPYCMGLLLAWSAGEARGYLTATPARQTAPLPEGG